MSDTRCHCGDPVNPALVVVSCAACYARGCHLALHDCAAHRDDERNDA